MTVRARRAAGGELLESYLTRGVNRSLTVDLEEVATSVLGRLLDEDAPETPLDAVPVWLVTSGLRSGILFISQITHINETNQFKKDLKRAHPKITKLWNKTKVQLAEGTRVGGTNFEKLRGYKDRYSVRLDGATRALLRDGHSDGWFAEKVGDHDHVYGK